MEGRFITLLIPKMHVAHPFLALMIAQHMRTAPHMDQIAMHLVVGRHACLLERPSQHQATAGTQMECLRRGRQRNSLSWTKLSIKRS